MPQSIDYLLFRRMRLGREGRKFTSTRLLCDSNRDSSLRSERIVREELVLLSFRRRLPRHWQVVSI